MSDDADDIDAIRQRKRDRLIDAHDEPSTPQEPIHVDGESLADLVGRHDVVLVDYYADWCGPCKMLEPTVESLAADGVVVAKVDVDANQSLARERGIRGVPTLELYADGEQVERLSGVQDEGTLRTLVARYE
jgi:thioredoxin 1